MASSILENIIRHKFKISTNINVSKDSISKEFLENLILNLI